VRSLQCSWMQLCLELLLLHEEAAAAAAAPCGTCYGSRHVPCVQTLAANWTHDAHQSTSVSRLSLTCSYASRHTQKQIRLVHIC
jgi:hypothetical protein